MELTVKNLPVNTPFRLKQETGDMAASTQIYLSIPEMVFGDHDRGFIVNAIKPVTPVVYGWFGPKREIVFIHPENECEIVPWSEYFSAEEVKIS